jgi:hypothetical protein
VETSVWERVQGGVRAYHDASTGSMEAGGNIIWDISCKGEILIRMYVVETLFVLGIIMIKMTGTFLAREKY